MAVHGSTVTGGACGGLDGKDRFPSAPLPDTMSIVVGRYDINGALGKKVDISPWQRLRRHGTKRKRPAGPEIGAWRDVPAGGGRCRGRTWVAEADGFTARSPHRCHRPLTCGYAVRGGVLGRSGPLCVR